MRWPGTGRGKGGAAGAVGRHLVKRSFTIRGHRTSVALEPEFWAALDAAAAARGAAAAALICKIDASRTRPLASALRVFLLKTALGLGEAQGADGPPAQT